MHQLVISALFVVAASALPINFTPLTTPAPSNAVQENGPFTLGPDVEQSLSKLPNDQQEAVRNMLNSLIQMAQKLNEVAQDIQKNPEGFKAAVMKNIQGPQGTSNQGVMKPL